MLLVGVWCSHTARPLDADATMHSGYVKAKHSILRKSSRHTPLPEEAEVAMETPVKGLDVALPDVVVIDSAHQWRSKWWNTIVECAGAVAGAATTAAFIPQVVEVYMTGETDGLSLPMYCIFVSGVVMWIVYGVCKRAGAMIGANIVTFVLAGYILYRIVDNEVLHPQQLHEPPAAPPPLLPPPGAPPPIEHARLLMPLLADVRATRVWRALAAI